MAKPIPKKRPILAKSPVLRKKVRKSAAIDWLAVGFDTSTYSISGAAIASSHGKLFGPHTISLRWEKGTDYFARMTAAAKAADLMHDLMGPMIGAELDQVFIAIEEPVSFGHLQRMQSQSIKQQIQIQGAFMGGLLRWGWQNIYEIQANQWRKIVADDLGITIHKSKYQSEEYLPLPPNYSVLSSAVGKFRSRQWVEEFHSDWDGGWPDLISHNKLGVTAKPETSKAKSFQPDDRYDALAITEWMRREIMRREAN
jgi:hypothetical protein